MLRLLGTIAVSGVLGLSGAAWACGDVADNHDDSFAQMTKPQSVATVAPAKKSIETQPSQKADKRTVARAPQSGVAAVKVATRSNSD